MRIIEIFKSIQCEGVLIGKVSILVRLAGCNLCCRWCDEKKSSSITGGYEISLHELILRIEDLNCKNIVVTGGEPLLSKEIEDLTRKLKRNDFHVTVETNGTIIRNINADLVSISPKLSHSQPVMNRDLPEKYKRINIDALLYYINNYNYQLKFVVEKEKDFDEIEDILIRLRVNNKDDVLIMPLASSRRELYRIQKKIVDLCIQKGYRYANRLQLQIWGKGKEEKDSPQYRKRQNATDI